MPDTPALLPRVKPSYESTKALRLMYANQCRDRIAKAAGHADLTDAVVDFIAVELAEPETIISLHAKMTARAAPPAKETEEKRG